MTIDKREILVPEHLSGKRLDFVIHELVHDFSRSKIQQWIQQGHVKVNGLIFQPKKKLYGGELLEIFVQKDQEQTCNLKQKILILILFIQMMILQ
jgi:23S rRNA pseudouridine1911/1915/1917 synthase